MSLFDQTVLPILLYGAEVWGVEKIKIVERIQLKFCKIALHVKSSTTTSMVYGELGRCPVDNIINLRMVTFWAKIINGPTDKYSNRMYRLCLDLHRQGICNIPWLDKIKNILDTLGFSDIWNSQDRRVFNTEWLVNAVKLKLDDQYRQTWLMNVNASSKCTNYRTFKDELKFEDYLDELPRNLAISLTKFRCSNHRLPVEVGSYYHIPRPNRTCTKCQNNTIGDEYHFIQECPFLSNLRKKYIPRRLFQNPNTLKLKEPMSTKMYTMKVCKFIKEGLKLYT